MYCGITSDVTTAIPTEEEFRRQMRIPDDAVVLKVTSGVNWAVTSTFSLKTKSDDRNYLYIQGN